ncbi:GGDEF domain-containing protein [Cognatazoarcus halotolerans]|uniref:GGDEF domain-containing protein n=1 Tax=Cognatazoarcus halotolerans TaxID=2686016 RepID=UPI00135B13C8|nr:sensor domain-containing diguanylate cyclase [Cognatazoarcus halotolerans]MCB1898171.1 diguanylate cyclase [Rhodocyclaceae bacterium]MCP5311163.1 diguanylate cyclase [Zoogloeaceae bacterium]
MNLKPRILILTASLVVVSAIAAWGMVRELGEGIIEEWALRHAEKQVLYDKARTLQPVLREIALARQLANSQQIREWTRDPDNPQLTRRAIAEMETFRLNFADRNYFIALLGNGRYYYNNAEDEFGGRQYRYALDPDKAEDRWFYDIIQQQRDMHINVNPDVNLGVTKLWIDVLIRDGQKIVGVAGTGLDLTRFIREVVDSGQPGITSLFVDHGGAIQAYRDQRMIDFASITKKPGERNSLDLLLDRDTDRQAVKAAMKELETSGVTVVSRFVEVQGKRYLAGVAYLPEIDWYEITLLDLDTLLPISSFTGILTVYALTLLGALALFNFAMGRFVLGPLAELETAVSRVQLGEFPPESLSSGRTDEIGRLMLHFRSMAQSLLQSKQELESKVRERTEALDRLTKIDPLTELLNRRGMSGRIDEEISRAGREDGRFGILWLDIDDFKDINDRHGHVLGDLALKTVAEIIRSVVRPYDSAARWGGDEFLVLVRDCDEARLRALGERIRQAIEACDRLRAADGSALRLGASIGGALGDGGRDSEAVLHDADRALYVAKNAGRNRVELAPPAA